MNVVREINRINEQELKLGVSGSWHDEYKDSAYIYVGGLHFDLTEGDVITIFSQYGEVMDVNLPRDKHTGKTKGFGFLMYEDQRSTILAVDNLNGANVLDKTLRVDHVKDYKQPKEKGDDGEWHERDEQSMNAKPEITMEDGPASDSDASSTHSIDPEDPMRDFLIAQRREEKAKKAKKTKSKDKHKDETPEERRARKERKREKKARKEKNKSQGIKGVEDLLKSLGSGPFGDHDRTRSPDSDGRRGGRDRSPRPRSRSRPPPSGRSARSRSRTPVGRHADKRMRSPTSERSRDREYSGRRYNREEPRRGGSDYDYHKTRRD
ncbi:hypothetical protein CONPUDRAFT_111036 [Coniophora puteana RWD-64-598 SS2]|uniref:RRM domain-containing protein n=1 Tax=Coniophora puteana (strain RWD-64-598) TaxID=741705 RepID=A0A5M3MBN4_CONPW|nr:uncharacterized protein CONPUDRAFT_111036 [Coniophora puteana RWD-64-598 SS2]EIW76230.1 hypothetical protein CONPUDRAFT_111036 [Coniophora puteana RWD-64-598 SS2]